MATTKKILGIIPINRGDYNPSTNYYKDNVVQYNNCSYYCKVKGPISGIEPGTEDVKWGIWSGTPVVDELGNAENKVMSQRAISDEINKLIARIEILENSK